MNDPKQKYIEALYAAESPEIAAAREKIHACDFPVHIAPSEGRLLQILIKLAGIKTCVEIGTLGGYSSLWIADALPSNGHLYTCEHDEKRLDLAQQSLGKHSKISIIAGDANLTLPRLADEHAPFDMVFIDADKKSYLNYLDWAERALRPGGLIVADDTLLKGAVYMDELPYRIRASTRATVQKFNRRLADREKFNAILLSTDAGLTIAIKK